MRHRRLLCLLLCLAAFAGSGFVALPGAYWPFLALTVGCYVALTQAVKMRFLRQAWK